jgi:sugar (pentulose or hexulose) kinase
MAASKDRILALDVGTQSSRAVLHDRAGNECGLGRAAHAQLKYPVPGAALQDPWDIWRALRRAVRSCLEGQDAGRIAAIALTSQRSACVPVAADGEPLHDAVSWLDRRSATSSPLLDGLPALLLGLLPRTSLPWRLTGWSRPNILSESAPDAFAEARYWLTLSGWLSHRMTGRFVDAAGSIAGVWPFDVKAGRWHSAALVHRFLGFRPGSLPELVPAGAPLGALTEAAAAALGVEAGVPLIAVGGDKQAEVLGGGGSAGIAGLGGLSLGTAASVCVPERRCRRSAVLHYLTNAAAEPGAWVREYVVMRGFWMVSWFVREFAAEERLEAEQRGVSADAILSERALAEVAPGAAGLLLLPRFTPAPDVPLERGALLGLSEEHGRLAVYRAIIEGVALDLRRGLRLLERTGGGSIDVLRVGGGGSRSPAVVETCAAVLNRPLELCSTTELSALGASICAATSLGWYASSAQAAAAMSTVRSRVEPDPKLAAFYARLYARAFVPALRRVRPFTSWLARHRMEP